MLSKKMTLCFRNITILPRRQKPEASKITFMPATDSTFNYRVRSAFFPRIVIILLDSFESVVLLKRDPLSVGATHDRCTSALFTSIPSLYNPLRALSLPRFDTNINGFQCIVEEKTKIICLSFHGSPTLVQVSTTKIMDRKLTFDLMANKSS